ncbi:DUF3299 domain-containing protein [Shewanella electrodiphila]|uniref:DUF3299 domain-containing protein n=1 Tax=Shewanella electrodiphila TaxID=934143 RepID=A0ABT0KRP0_9GAMM|nr:DUF3299 domain-containing protein [Shewanella electrodiphila]MCL1046525.1 DUF3299 domain-containing protein [Shewanella electrodiphila]
MKKSLILFIAVLFSSQLAADEAMSILWQQLAPGPSDLPVATNVNQDLDGKTIIIPGFIVPLDGLDVSRSKNFLLTPQQGACFHKPPAPANQLIHVVFDEPIAIPDAHHPMYIAGTLSIKSAQSGFAKTGYALKGIEAIEYPISVAKTSAAHSHQH